MTRNIGYMVAFDLYTVFLGFFCPYQHSLSFTVLPLQLENLVDDACNTDDPSVAKIKQHCCEKTARKRVKCITKLLLRHFAKAKQVPMSCPIIL